jgi:hypothetical protein
MAQQIVNLEKLAEAQEAADAAVEAAGATMEAATLAAEKVADLRSRWSLRTKDKATATRQDGRPRQRLVMG